MRRSRFSFLFCLLAVSLLGCRSGQNESNPQASGADSIACDTDNGGLTLPEGFCAVVVADAIGRARHIVVRDNGDIYVAMQDTESGGGITALRDTTGDGVADRIERFGSYGGTGIALFGDYLYFAPDTAVVRYRLSGEGLVPEGADERVVVGFPDQGQHAAKSISIDPQGSLYVNIGAPSNSCQVQDRTDRSPGQDPCPLLEEYAGIWRFAADSTGQQRNQGRRYATGIRNAVAITWNDQVNSLFAVQHGRDQLSQNWSNLYTNEQNAELPAEEFFKVSDGSNFGWPYCFYDQIQKIKVLAPEYGGDGKTRGRCEQFEDPIVAFPGHWAPNAVVFNRGTLFPERYAGGAFIAFHGSWNRGPLEQQGYNVAFVPFQSGNPAGEWEVFANGFAGTERIESPGDAQYRPTGLAVGPDGSLYIADSVKGRIWRVVYKGA